MFTADRQWLRPQNPAASDDHRTRWALHYSCSTLCLLTQDTGTCPGTCLHVLIIIQDTLELLQAATDRDHQNVS